MFACEHRENTFLSVLLPHILTSNVTYISPEIMQVHICILAPKKKTCSTNACTRLTSLLTFFKIL